MTWSARVSAGRLVGRQAEQRLVRQALQRAAQGEPCALVVVGEAGVGKTRFVRELVDEAADGLGAQVLWGTCVQFGASTIPFAPLVGALRMSLPITGTPSDSVRLLPEIAGRINDIARRSLTIVAVDDLQWADVSSLDALAYLIAGFGAHKLAILATCREENRPDGHPLHGWLADMRRMPSFEEMPLGRLDLEETAELLADVRQVAPDLELAALVRSRSDGNPYLTELLGAALEPDAHDLPADAPQRLKDALMAAWHRLDPVAREVTRMLAVGGRPTDVDLLESVARRRGIAPAAVSSALGEAQDHGVVRFHGDGRLWFQHPLLADVLYRAVPSYDRRRLHADFATLLEGRAEGMAADLAVHHERAGHFGLALTWSLRAADAAAAVHAPAEEAQQLLRACSLWARVGKDARGSLGRQVDLLLRAAQVSQRIGNYGDARRLLEDARRLVDERAEPLLSSRLLSEWCEVVWASAGPATALVQERYDALRLTDALPDSFERVLALIGLGAAEHWDGRHESGEARMNEAVEVAERMGSDLAMAHALNGWVSVRTSSPADELPERRRALALARACGSVDQIVNGTIWLMNALEGELRFEEAADVGRQGFEEASRLGELNWSYFVAAGAASNLVALGRWSEARSLLREALTVRCVGVPGALARLVAADLALGEGDVDAAEKHVTRALEVVDPDFGGLRADLICVLAEVRVAQGRPGEAVAWIRERLDVGGPAPADDIDLEVFICLVQAITEVIREARSREDRVAEKVAEGELAQWLEVFTARLPVLAERDLHSRSTRLLRAFAELARSRGDADEVQRWEQLARRAKELGLQRREAYALLRLSEALVADGAPRATLAPTLRRLHVLASGMGATPFREEAEALARIARVSLAPVRLPRQTGSADTSEKRSEIAGLTAREEEILAHLVAGRTNAEIAKSLVISDKTVSVHVSNILRKTGTSSRTQIAARALRLA